MVYTRTVKGQELTFGVSGKLYKDALVMFDRQTDSLWTQVDGSVLRGKLKGARLEPVPAVQTTWAEWKRLHPDTLVLKKERRVTGTAYARYFRNPDMIGVAGSRNPDDRLGGKVMVVSVRLGQDALAVPLEKLEDKLVHETSVNGTPLVMVYNPGSHIARVFDRRVDGKTLTFKVIARGREAVLRDAQTGTRWSGLTGVALDEKARGQKLKPVPHMVNFWFAWAAYNPRTRLEP